MLSIKVEKPPETGIYPYCGILWRTFGLALRTIWGQRKSTNPSYRGYKLILGLWVVQLVIIWERDKET